MASLAALGLLALSTIAGGWTLYSFGRESFLRWRHVNLVRADLGVSDDKPYVNLAGVDLGYADLREARLIGALMDIAPVREFFQKCRFECAHGA